MQNEERWEVIYNQINGAYVPGFCNDARDESSMDGILGPLLAQAYAARDRLSERLNVDPCSDSDLESLVNWFEDFSRACGKLMYHYGYRDGANTI